MAGDTNGSLRAMVDELGPEAVRHFMKIAQGEVAVVDTLQDEKK